jgi:hypothetical protein
MANSSYFIHPSPHVTKALNELTAALENYNQKLAVYQAAAQFTLDLAYHKDPKIWLVGFSMS